MNQRKETPDVLSEILGGGVSPPATTQSPPLPAKPKSARKPRRASTSQSRSTSPVKWEYIVASFQDHKGWRPRYLNGVELDQWMDGPLMHEYIDRRGEEGWELTTACSGMKLYGLNDKFQLFFKRPK